MDYAMVINQFRNYFVDVNKGNSNQIFFQVLHLEHHLQNNKANLLTSISKKVNTLGSFMDYLNQSVSQLGGMNKILPQCDIIADKIIGGKLITSYDKKIMRIYCAIDSLKHFKKIGYSNPNLLYYYNIFDLLYYNNRIIHYPFSYNLIPITSNIIKVAILSDVMVIKENRVNNKNKLQNK